MICCCGEPEEQVSSTSDNNEHIPKHINSPHMNVMKRHLGTVVNKAVKWSYREEPQGSVSPEGKSNIKPLKSSLRATTRSGNLNGDNEREGLPCEEGMSGYLDQFFCSKANRPRSNNNAELSSSLPSTRISVDDSADLVPMRYDGMMNVEEKDEVEGLSDITRFVDDETRQKYVDSCILLKKVVIQKEDQLSGSEHRYLDGLVRSLSTTKNGMLSEVQSALHVLETNPAFRDEELVQFDDPDNFPLSPLSEKLQRWTIPVRHKIKSSTASGISVEFFSAVDKDKVEIQESNQVWWDFDETMEPVSVDKEDEIVRFDGWSNYQHLESDPYRILGTSVNNRSVTPRVLSPANMEAMRGFLPDSVAGQNFWLKFSLIRDGASLKRMLRGIRGSHWTIIAIETTEGEVFGSFAGAPWRKGPGWYGSNETFLWRLKRSRLRSPQRLSEKRNFDSEMEVYPYTGSDALIQFCIDKAIGIGGGEWVGANPHKNEPQGIGLLIDGDLAGGETNSCATFGNPRLCRRTNGENEFEIGNLEVWTMSPCETVEKAEDFEARQLFREENWH